MSIETEEDLAALKRVGKVVGQTLQQMKAFLRPGITTFELDGICADLLSREGARSAPELFYQFPGAIQISVNEEAVHSVPGRRVLQAGDLVKLDLTVEQGGYVADAAITVALPPVSPLQRRLISCAESAFQRACQAARAGRRVNEIGRALENEVHRHGFHVLYELQSHGVGRAIHEAPEIPNYYDPELRERLTEGLVITIEPIISAGTDFVKVGSDGWTYSTLDGSLAAHYEHTLVITRQQPILLTAA